jgi:hypothetical protein
VIVRAAYVDGSVEEGSPHEWSSWPGHGVDWAEIGHARFTRVSGMSVYWLYPEEESWVLGGGPVGYGNLVPETVVGGDDQHATRQIGYMPDLPLTSVKLGWWWPSEPRRPVY